MTTTAVQTFCALLAVLVLAFTVVVGACRMAGRRSAGGRRAVETVAVVAPGLAAAIAVGCMAGSLYFSEVAHYLPCTLCWYQRIAMYPLAVLSTIAAIRRDGSIRSYLAVLAAIGAVVSTYHWLLERFPGLDTGACSSTIPCEYIWFEKFGFVTLPFMAGCGFLAVLVLATLPTSHSAAVPAVPPNKE
jgi:disulfide bond formation protein DsbB